MDNFRIHNYTNDIYISHTKGDLHIGDVFKYRHDTTKTIVLFGAFCNGLNDEEYESGIGFYFVDYEKHNNHYTRCDDTVRPVRPDSYLDFMEIETDHIVIEQVQKAAGLP